MALNSYTLYLSVWTIQAGVLWVCGRRVRSIACEKAVADVDRGL